jgi:hypothetical protein
VRDAWVSEMVSLGAPLATAEAEVIKALKEGKLDEAVKTGSKELVKEVAIEVVSHVLEHAFHSVSGAMTLPVKLVELAKAMAESVADDADTGHERAEARLKSAMHVLITGSLNGLPQDFVDQTRARYAADAPSGMVDRMTRALGRGDNALMGVIQLHCDQGIVAARTMVDAHQTPEEFFRGHPDLGKRFENDPAFHDGFAGTLYAREHGQYDDVMKALDARDVRYTQQHVAFRG